ncbi:MAG TPA: HAMP domain-containing sensor histidine kinase [Azoarcus taiwanensis]|nr:HAMP domain-containing sensor histidine kinase [Azoarcus taiwanensis]
MLLFRDLSFRYKIPLRAIVLVLVTAGTLTAANVMREYDQLRSDLLDNAESLGRVLASALITPLLHDDLWRAYEIVSLPVETEVPSALGAETLMVLDPQMRVYVSTRPRTYPVRSELVEHGPVHAQLAVELAALRPAAGGRAIELAEADDFFVAMPIVADGVSLGTLVMAYPKSIFQPRFLAIVNRSALVTLVVLLLLLPMSAYWGRRMADPLVQLADCMGKVGDRIPPESEYQLYESRDEIGLAGTQLKSMLRSLREKQALEQQVIASERLAAVGRITAGIAHEINNPLGGMLNAISTYKKHGQPELAVSRTLPLLERGLQQIRDTVAALLVETRVQSHPLTQQDLEDIDTLLHPHTSRRQVALRWEGRLAEPLSLPSTAVRQIMLNLLLNAVEAAAQSSEVLCRVCREAGQLRVDVLNQGEPIAAERLTHLFEPFVGGRSEGHGLGLWVTYQLVQQLGGSIDVRSDAEHGTVFTVVLPVSKEDAG